MVKELIAPNYSFTFDELRFMPGLSKENPTYNLETCIDQEGVIKLKAPLISSSMQTVSNDKLCIELAMLGGLGAVFCSQHIVDEVYMIKQVKNHKAAFVTNPITISEKATLNDLINLHKIHGHTHFPVLARNGMYRGFAQYSPIMDLLSDSQKKKAIEVLDYGCLEGQLSNISYEDVSDFFKSNLYKRCVPIVHKSRLQAVSFAKEVVDVDNYPNQLLDNDKRLMVGGAVNTRDFKKRVPAIVKAGVDVIFIDSSDGYSEYQRETIKFIKKTWPDMPIIGGNVVNADAYEYLVDAGADGVMVGIGGGSICITQEVKGIGRGQARALYEVSKVAENVPLISDGAVSKDLNIVKALAFNNVNAVMGGFLFVPYYESPAITRTENGMTYKVYYGEGTNKAQEWKFLPPKHGKCTSCGVLDYQQQNISGRYGHELIVEEGVEILVPPAGKLSVGINKRLVHIRNIMNNLGCYNIPQLQKNSILEYVSEGSRIEGRAHN